jgi:antitoxin HicB
VLRYPVKLLKDTNETILVDVPDAIESALMCYIDLRREIPAPRATSRGPFVTLPALTEAKLALYTAMRTARIGKAELARRLNCHLPQVDRLLDLRHASRLDQLEAAFRALGKQLSIQICEAAEKASLTTHAKPFKTAA